MNVVGMPTERISAEQIAEILRGGAEKVVEAGCVLLGGHSIENPEPVYGLSVTGIVHPERYLTNAWGREGDVLVLTKPLGTGIISTAIKREVCPEGLSAAAVAAMSALNDAGAELAERGWVCAATDITGFGLLGHLASLARESKVVAQIRASQVPVLDPAVEDLIRAGCVPGGTRRNLQAATRVEWESGVAEWQRILLADAQTSGGLLLCVPPVRLADVLALLESLGTLSRAVVGELGPVDAGGCLIRVAE
jgi:selenide,water dikinase